MSLCAVALLSSCRGVRLSTADEQMARGEYYDAARTYRKIYNKLTRRQDRGLRGEVAYKMAEAHRMLGQHARAAGAYQNAIRYGWPDSLAQLRLAQSLHASGNYRDAVRAYEEFLMRNPASEEARSGLRGSRMALDTRDSKTRYTVRNSRLLNTRRSDFAPMYNGQTLYLTTTNEKVQGALRSEITGMKRSDIWMSRKNEHGQWMRPEPAEGDVNSEADEGIVSFSPDGMVMYLTRAVRKPDADTGTEIWVSHRSDAKWSAPVRFDLLSDTLYSYGHPAVSPSGYYLYFASDLPGNGGKDIWCISLREGGAVPFNLGKSINTPGNEMFPYMLTDSVMYFASDGHPGFGGLDIFRAELTPQGVWQVENMGQPINSQADDFGITFEPGGRQAGFFSSSRGDNRGYDHIYSFELPDLKINISGYVTDRDEEPVPGAVVRIVGNDGSNRKAVARDDGSFSFPVERGVSYAMLAGARGYLNARQEFTADDEEADIEYQVDFMLAALNKPNIVENIFYDFDKATLRPESREALDGLVEMLNDNPHIAIEMASHTDRKGSEAYNERLSQRRAKAVVDYLIEAGIEPERLEYRGYGESTPKTVTKRVAREFPQFSEGTVLDENFIDSLSPEDQEVADQINRRTEFKITSVEYNLY